MCAYPPGANRLWRSARGRTIVSADAARWKADTAWRARLAGVRPISGAVAIEIQLHPRLTAKGRASLTRLDLDAPIKPLLDALNGVAYADDKQIVEIRAALGEAVEGGGLSFAVSAA